MKDQLTAKLQELEAQQIQIQASLNQAQQGVNQLTQQLIHTNGAIAALNELLGECADVVEDKAPQA